MTGFVPKSIKVETRAPYYVIVTFETGQVIEFNMELGFKMLPELLILKEHPEVFNKPRISICDYMINWEMGDKLLSFHCDYVYNYGKVIR